MCSPDAIPHFSIVGSLLCSVYSCWEKKCFNAGVMVERFVLSSLVLVVCCWPSSYFPLLLWVLWLMDHLLHDQCCSSHDHCMPLSYLDVNLQIGWALCSVPLWINFLFPPILLFYSCAILLLHFSHISVECLNFLPSWHPGTERVHLEYQH